MLAISMGTFLGPLIANYIANSMGWQWIGWFGAIFNGMMAVVVYFGLEETAFDRNAHSIVEGVQRTDVSEKTANDIEVSKLNNEKSTANSNSDREMAPVVESQAPTITGKTYWQRIKLITLAPNVRGTGFKQYFSRLFHTLRVFSFPAVWFAGLQWGAQDAWLTFYLTSESDNWTGPPWNYGTAALGVMDMPCLIGAVLGCAYGGWFSDPFVRWMTRRNGGIQEAEMRLWLLLPTIALFPTGMLLFGAATQYGWPWPAPYVALGFIGFGWGNAGDGMCYMFSNFDLNGLADLLSYHSCHGISRRLLPKHDSRGNGRCSGYK